MNYAIDITRHHTKLAMLALGIEPEELILKSLDDFSGRNVNEEVQQLRFNYYTRKLQEVIRQIKSYIREEAMRRIQSVGNSPETSPQLFLTQSYENEETVDEIAEIKQIERNKIRENFNDINNSIMNSKAIEKRLQMGHEARLKVQSEVNSRRLRLQKFKEKQQENIRKIRKELENKAKRYPVTSTTPQKYRGSSVDNSQLFTRTYSEFNESEGEIESKIQQIDQRMIRSQRNYEKSVQQKREAATKLLEKNINHSNNDRSAELDVERVAKMIEKRRQVELRRHSFIVKQQEYRTEMRKKHEHRRSVALERLKEEEKLEMLRSQAIERRMEISARLLKQKHESWVKELELKNELSKLRDEEALLNAERKRRVMKYRREQVLEKQLIDKERIDFIKEERQADINKKMEISIRRMIEKEKTHRMLEIIKKSPESKMAKKKLIELEIIKPSK